MKGTFFGLLVAAGLLFTLTLSAQDRELTVEELYLQNIELQIMREQAFSEDLETKLSVLNEIEVQIDAGNSNNDYGFILEFLSMEGVQRQVRESGRLINNFPEVRRRAAGLLGRLGGQQAQRALLTVLVTDNEPMVVAEAAYALGVLGDNENNRVVRALVFTLEKQNPQNPDANLAYAICLALEKLAQRNNGIKDPAAYRALVRISQGPYITTVRRKALQSLDELRKYQ